MAYDTLYKNPLYFYLKKYFYKPQLLRLTTVNGVYLFRRI